MTDTTDIAALREALKTCDRNDYRTWPQLPPHRLEALLDLLEAERQRAERGEAAAGIIQQMYNELNDSVKHIRIEASAGDAAFLEMKKQYSTQFDRCRELTGKLEVERQRAQELEQICKNEYQIRKKMEAEIAALKAKLANPVVLGSSDVMSRNFAIKAIYAAGFTVKGYSPEQSVFQGVRP